MNYELHKIDDNIDSCVLYINEISDDLSEFIMNNLLEIVSGKLEAERCDPENYKEALKDAAKFIYLKKADTNRVGIVGELLLHSVLRCDELKDRFISVGPTIGYSDSYKGFYKGFDGCYYSESSIWIVEVKSQVKTENLDNDNKTKVKEASGQIKVEVEDEKINRWEKAKKQVRQQLSEIEQDETKIFKLLSKKNRNSYNQMIGTLLICENTNFSIDYIRNYSKDLFHDNVSNQKIFLVCIRSFDFEQIINAIEKQVELMCE